MGDTASQKPSEVCDLQETGRASLIHRQSPEVLMGAIRKTASVLSLGVVNFRSADELLERERVYSGELEAEREKLSRKAARLSRRAKKAERRAEKAQLAALDEAKKAKRERRRATRSAKSPVVDAADAAVIAGRRARRKAKKAAKRAARSARKEARSVVDKTSAPTGS